MLSRFETVEIVRLPVGDQPFVFSVNGESHFVAIFRELRIGEVEVEQDWHIGRIVSYGLVVGDVGVGEVDRLARSRADVENARVEAASALQRFSKGPNGEGPDQMGPWGECKGKARCEDLVEVDIFRIRHIIDRLIERDQRVVVDEDMDRLPLFVGPDLLSSREVAVKPNRIPLKPELDRDRVFVIGAIHLGKDDSRLDGLSFRGPLDEDEIEFVLVVFGRRTGQGDERGEEEGIENNHTDQPFSLSLAQSGDKCPIGFLQLA